LKLTKEIKFLKKKFGHKDKMKAFRYLLPGDLTRPLKTALKVKSRDLGGVWSPDDKRSFLTTEEVITGSTLSG